MAWPDALHAGYLVKIRISRNNVADTVLFHHLQMDTVPRQKAAFHMVCDKPYL